MHSQRKAPSIHNHLIPVDPSNARMRTCASFRNYYPSHLVEDSSPRMWSVGLTADLHAARLLFYVPGVSTEARIFIYFHFYYVIFLYFFALAMVSGHKGHQCL